MLFSDDYTGSDVYSHLGKSFEERSVNTDSGLPDTQQTDDTYSPGEKKRKKKGKKAKKNKKATRKEEEKRKEEDYNTDASGNSRQY